MIRLLEPINQGVSEGRHAQAIIKLFIDNSPKLRQAIAEGASKRELSKALRVYLNEITRGRSEGFEGIIDRVVNTAKIVGSGGG